jgi:hypothetical protein
MPVLGLSFQSKYGPAEIMSEPMFSKALSTWFVWVRSRSRSGRPGVRPWHLEHLPAGIRKLVEAEMTTTPSGPPQLPVVESAQPLLRTSTLLVKKETPGAELPGRSGGPT